jgi:hypothetical protein
LWSNLAYPVGSWEDTFKKKITPVFLKMFITFQVQFSAYLIYSSAAGKRLGGGTGFLSACLTSSANFCA